MSDRVFVTVPMPPAMERQARIEAAKIGKSRAEFVRIVLAEYLDKVYSEQQNQKQQAEKPF